MLIKLCGYACNLSLLLQNGQHTIIMLGNNIPSGTGFCDIFLDEQEHSEIYKELYKHDENELEYLEEDLDILLTADEGECSNDNFTFSFE